MERSIKEMLKGFYIVFVILFYKTLYKSISAKDIKEETDIWD